MMKCNKKYNNHTFLNISKKKEVEITINDQVVKKNNLDNQPIKKKT